LGADGAADGVTRGSLAHIMLWTVSGDQRRREQRYATQTVRLTARTTRRAINTAVTRPMNAWRSAAMLSIALRARSETPLQPNGKFEFFRWNSTTRNSMTTNPRFAWPMEHIRRGNAYKDQEQEDVLTVKSAH